MTPISLLRFFGEARGMSFGSASHARIDAVVGQCALETVAHKPIGKLSKGYRQRSLHGAGTVARPRSVDHGRADQRARPEPDSWSFAS